METKKCTDCPGEKLITDFSWKSEPKGIRQSKCKPCYRKMRNRWYQDHKESEVKTIMARTRRYRKEVKAWLDNYKSKHPCGHCKDNRIPVLQFHHLDPKEKDISIALASQHGWSHQRMEKEIAKCIVLCSNCHIMEHNRLRGGLV